MNYLYKGWLKIYKKEYKGRNFEILEDKDAVGALVEDTNGKFLLVRQFRVPLGRESLEIPAGCIDKDGLTPEEIMVEELEEEGDLNIKAEDLKLLITFCPNIGISKSTYRLYYCKYNGVGISKAIDDQDVFESLWLTPEEYLEKIEKREILDVKSQLAYYMIMNKKMTQF